MGAESHKGVWAVVIASLFWGTTGTAASFTIELGPLAIGAFSTGFGGLLLVFFNRRELKRDARILLKRRTQFIFGALSVAIYPLAFYTSMSLAGVAIGTIVSIATAPLFTVLLERLYSQKSISHKWMLSFVVGATGVTLLTLGKTAKVYSAPDIQATVFGIILGCIAGLAYACYSWVARSYIEQGVHSRAALSGLFGGAALLLLPTLWFTGQNLLHDVNNLMVGLYMAVIPMFLGYVLFSYGLRFIAASEATLITLIEPLIAFLLAVFFLGERFKAIGWWGGAMVLLCLLLQSYEPKPRPARQNMSS